MTVPFSSPAGGARATVTGSTARQALARRARASACWGAALSTCSADSITSRQRLASAASCSRPRRWAKVCLRRASSAWNSSSSRLAPRRRLARSAASSAWANSPRSASSRAWAQPRTPSANTCSSAERAPRWVRRATASSARAVSPAWSRARTSAIPRLVSACRSRSALFSPVRSCSAASKSRQAPSASSSRSWRSPRSTRRRASWTSSSPVLRWLWADGCWSRRCASSRRPFFSASWACRNVSHAKPSIVPAPACPREAGAGLAPHPAPVRSRPRPRCAESTRPGRGRVLSQEKGLLAGHLLARGLAEDGVVADLLEDVGRLGLLADRQGLLGAFLLHLELPLLDADARLGFLHVLLDLADPAVVEVEFAAGLLGAELLQLGLHLGQLGAQLFTGGDQGAVLLPGLGEDVLARLEHLLLGGDRGLQRGVGVEVGLQLALDAVDGEVLAGVVDPRQAFLLGALEV